MARAASLPEVCGGTALYFDPLNVEDMASALLEIATNPALSLRLSVGGVERARSFTWEACANRTAEGLRVCLEDG